MLILLLNSSFLQRIERGFHFTNSQSDPVQIMFFLGKGILKENTIKKLTGIFYPLSYGVMICLASSKFASQHGGLKYVCEEFHGRKPSPRNISLFYLSAPLNVYCVKKKLESFSSFLFLYTFFFFPKSEKLQFIKKKLNNAFHLRRLLGKSTGTGQNSCFSRCQRLLWRDQKLR